MNSCDYMKRKLSICLFGLSLMVLATSCGEYNKVLKSTDYNYKYEYAKKAFEKKKYGQATTILADLVTVFKGTANAEESLYLLGLSHYENKDYMNSGSYFKTYYQHYPKGQYTELARFYAGYGYYLDSPEPQLDQTGTYKAIEELQNFLDYFPKSDKATIAQNAIFELQDKLVWKELQNAQLYYKNTLPIDCKKVPDNTKPRRACNQACDRSGMEPGTDRRTGRGFRLYHQHQKGKTHQL